MLKTATRSRLNVIVTTGATALVITAFAGLVSAGATFADHWRGPEWPVTLSGYWAPFNRCPVDNPAMLAAEDEKTIALCFSDNTPNGSMAIGNLTVALKNVNHQFGITDLSGTPTGPVIEPAGGGVVSEPVELPGGLRGLICPSRARLARLICRGSGGSGELHDGADAVTGTLESAGTAYNFDLLAGLALGAPIASVPVKVHLQNQLLGDNCYIGSDAEPIVLQPAALTPPTEFAVERFDDNGTPDLEGGPLARIKVIGETQGESSFAVPAASGCGFMGAYDRAINSKVGLPSPVGKNSVLFNENSAYAGGENEPGPNDGKELSEAWHSAVESPEAGGRHGFGHEPSSGGRRWSGHEVEEAIQPWLRHGH